MLDFPFNVEGSSHKCIRVTVDWLSGLDVPSSKQCNASNLRVVAERNKGRDSELWQRR